MRPRAREKGGAVVNYARQRPYVGRSIETGRLTVFRSRGKPTEETHGETYTYAIGPFRTVRGARYMADCGENNPHCVTVEQAERLAELFERARREALS
jgi:hypothetical protein